MLKLNLIVSFLLLPAICCSNGLGAQQPAAQKAGQEQQEYTFDGKVESQGIPLKDVSMVLLREKRLENGKIELVEVGRSKPNEDGNFSFNGPAKKFKPDDRSSSFTIFCYDKDATLIGGVNTFADFRSGNKSTTPYPPVLMEFETRNLQFVNQLGKPIVGVKVDTVEFGAKPFSEVIDARTQFRYLRSLSSKTGQFHSSTTDDDGRVSVRIPKNGSAKLRVFISSNSHFEVDVSPKATQIELNSSANISGQLVSEDAKFQAENAGLTFFIRNDIEPTNTYYRRFRVDLNPAADGKFSIAQAMPGKYQIRVQCNDERFYTSQQLDLEVEPGQKAILPPLQIQKGIPISGRVIDKQTKKGIPNVYINMHLKSNAAKSMRWSASFPTDENGQYKTYCPPGIVGIRFSRPPNSKYRTPTHLELFKFSAIEVLLGEMEKRVPDFVLSAGVNIDGLVVSKDGKPVPGIDVSICDTATGNLVGTKSDSQGKVKIEGVNAEVFLSVRAHNLKLGITSNGALTVDPQLYAKEPFKLVVSRDFAVFARGMVVDSKNRPIKDFRVDFSESQSFAPKDGVGFGLGGTLRGFAQTSDDGSFQSYAMQPGDRYSVIIHADGYNDFQGKSFLAKKGETLDLGRIRLTRSNLVVTGTVVGSDGKPIEGVKVFGTGDAKLPIAGKTDAAGTFKLNGWPESNAFLFAKKEGFRFYGQLIEDSERKLIIEMRRLDEPSALKIVEKPYSDEQRHELCKSLLNRLYKLPPDRRFKIDFVILLHMAKVDPEQAMKYAALPENAKHRPRIIATVAESIIDQNPEEALAMFAENRTSRTAYHVYRTACRNDLPLELRRKLAALFQQHVTLAADSSKIYKMAQLANLLQELGDDKTAKTIADEAFRFAEELQGDGRESFVKGLTAEYLSTFDLVRAKNLVAKMKETGGTSKSRHLGGIAFHIASSDPEAAVQIIESIDTGYTPRVVHRIAQSDILKAMKIVDNLFNKGKIKDGCDAMLAALLGGKNQLKPSEMEQKITRLFEVYMAHRQEFNRWTNYGFESGFAGYSAYTAHHFQLDDTPAFVMQSLASRRVKSQFSNQVSLQSASVKMARYLAMVDRSASRFLLEKIERQKEIVGSGGSSSVDKDDYFLAWALTDSKKAKQIFEELLKEEWTNMKHYRKVGSPMPWEFWPTLTVSRC